MNGISLGKALIPIVLKYLPHNSIHTIPTMKPCANVKQHNIAGSYTFIQNTVWYSTTLEVVRIVEGIWV